MVVGKLPAPTWRVPCVRATVGLALAIGFLGTQTASQGNAATRTSASTLSDAGAGAAGALPLATVSAAAARKLCYERISGLAGRRDTEQLRLVIDGDRVAGSYNWLPWGKDRRLGQLEGRLSASGTAHVRYRFLQEGQRASAPLTIVFNDQQARISWDKTQAHDPNAGPPPPPVTLPKQACAVLRPIPGL
ncbi:MAG: hypothetical protein VKI42_04555 [Synechococcaceae cyanobacterium]|nr:hypothetical protein [Synechococcaceae cyanobacterium]